MDFIEPIKYFDDTPKEELTERFNAMIGLGHIYTMLWYNDPIAVIGIIRVWEGYAQVFTVTTEKLKRCPMAFHKRVRDLLNSVVKPLRLRRIETQVRSDFDASKKWLNALGFEQEGLMKKYGNTGKDYYLYARIH
jgi:L-amino acid N-acyltransferase YncA